MGFAYNPEEVLYAQYELVQTIDNRQSIVIDFLKAKYRLWSYSCQLGVVVHAFNPSTEIEKSNLWESKTSLVYLVRPCLQTHKQTQMDRVKYRLFVRLELRVGEIPIGLSSWFRFCYWSGPTQRASLPFDFGQFGWLHFFKKGSISIREHLEVTCEDAQPQRTMGLFFSCSWRGSRWASPKTLGHLSSGWPRIFSYWSQIVGLDHASSYTEKPSDPSLQINWFPFNTEGSGVSFQMQ